MNSDEYGWPDVVRAISDLESRIAQIESDSLGRDLDLREGQRVIVDWLCEDLEPLTRKLDG